jgi:hypothetical protein
MGEVEPQMGCLVSRERLPKRGIFLFFGQHGTPGIEP